MAFQRKKHAKTDYEVFKELIQTNDYQTAMDEAIDQAAMIRMRFRTMKRDIHFLILNRSVIIIRNRRWELFG